MTSDPKFSFGVRELREAKKGQQLAVVAAPPKAAAKDTGGDPYNTSGSFDRKKNWMRVGKR
jgi:hypothetical protein